MSKCKDCGGSFSWVQRGGKWWKLDSDGGNHWERCRGSRAPAKLEIVKGPTTPRTDHSLPICACTTPPWVDCPHTLDQKFAAVMAINTEADERFHRLLDLVEAP